MLRCNIKCKKKIRPYLEGYAFVIISDHSSLLWLMRQTEFSGRLACWSLKLQGFNVKIEHRKGKENIVPDALSRTFSMENLIENCVNEISLDDNAFISSQYLELVKKVEDMVDKTNLLVKDGGIHLVYQKYK